MNMLPAEWRCLVLLFVHGKLTWFFAAKIMKQCGKWHFNTSSQKTSKVIIILSTEIICTNNIMHIYLS